MIYSKRDSNPSVPERLLDFPAKEEKLSKLYAYKSFGVVEECTCDVNR
jgi:hypothetical protein